jgi:hypothetical protein
MWKEKFIEITPRVRGWVYVFWPTNMKKISAIVLFFSGSLATKRYSTSRIIVAYDWYETRILCVYQKYCNKRLLDVLNRGLSNRAHFCASCNLDAMIYRDLLWGLPIKRWLILKVKGSGRLAHSSGKHCVPSNTRIFMRIVNDINCWAHQTTWVNKLYICRSLMARILSCEIICVPPDHLSLDSAPNIGPPMSRSELDKFKNCWNKSFRISKILTLLHQQFSNLLISQLDMSGPRLGSLSINR